MSHESIAEGQESIFDLEWLGAEEVEEEPQPVHIEVSPDQTTMFEGTTDRLFDVPSIHDQHWVGMPSYNHVDMEPWKSCIVHFKDRDDRNAFARLVGQTLTDKTKSIWYPKMEVSHFVTHSYASADPKQPKYPVYIISKGRADTRLTSIALESMHVPYHIVIEPQEYDEYAAVIDPEKILVLPFSNLGQGSIPARNWVWEHAIGTGAERHWILDDNIKSFHRFENNMLHRVLDGTCFHAAEAFVDRYENVGISGMQYFMFVTRKSANIPPFYLNTRVYSCILIQNDLKDEDGSPLRWRGRYNEDTDLCIRYLKGGGCTILFNAFICDKSTTMTMKGGNTEQLYEVEDGRLKMAQSLVDQHPDITRITWKWGRWQHHVDYSPFKRNKLVLRADAEIPADDGDWDMELQVHPGYEDMVMGSDMASGCDCTAIVRREVTE